MKISCVAMVRNESDIIEAFCRHLSALFDEIILIDHQSIDGTREYIEQLGRLDRRFHLYDFTVPAYEQSALINFAVKSLPPLSGSNWIFLLDADEFLPFADRSSFRARFAEIRDPAVLYMHWCNLIPVDYGQPTFELSARVWRTPTLSPYRKIAFQPKKLASPDFWIAQGNHELLTAPDGEPIGGVTADFALLHVPIRSVDQFCIKLAQGIAAYSLRGNSGNKLEGFHWTNIYETSRSSGLEPAVLNWVAANYGEHLDAEPRRLSPDGLSGLGYQETDLDIAEDTLIPAFDAFAPSSEVLFRVCAGFAEDARRPKPVGGMPQLTVDEQNRIAIPITVDEDRFAALEPGGPSGSPELAALEGMAFLDLFLRPAVWPIQCLAPTAWGGHIPLMFCLIAAMRPRRYVELGTYQGASFFAACQAAQRTSPGTECIAVDLWVGDEHTGQYDESVFDNFTYQLQRHFNDVASYLRSSFDGAAERFDAGSVDLLHIDGLHTYEAVKHDFETWKDRMTPEGVILFHDVNVHERDFGVRRLWDELKREYPAAEFLHSHGLGVLCLGEGSDSPVLRLIRLIQQDETYGKFTQWLLQNVGELTVQRAMAGWAEERLAATSEESDRLKLRVAQLERERDDERSRCERTLNDVYRSMSWRLTAPVRVIANWLRRLLRLG